MPSSKQRMSGRPNHCFPGDLSYRGGLHHNNSLRQKSSHRRGSSRHEPRHAYRGNQIGHYGSGPSFSLRNGQYPLHSGESQYRGTYRPELYYGPTGRGGGRPCSGSTFHSNGAYPRQFTGGDLSGSGFGDSLFSHSEGSGREKSPRDRLSVSQLLHLGDSTHIQARRGPRPDLPEDDREHGWPDFEARRGTVAGQPSSGSSLSYGRYNAAQEDDYSQEDNGDIATAGFSGFRPAQSVGTALITTKVSMAALVREFLVSTENIPIVEEILEIREDGRALEVLAVAKAMRILMA